uniref:Uncharacterized protein n=1 Tax=Anguilla anguilla TaxID=7936 RepID=A0A0E9PDS6_ANGAN
MLSVLANKHSDQHL